MSQNYFFEYYLQQQINAFLQEGYSEEQVIEALFHRGNLKLEAKGLKENTVYHYLIAGLILDSEGIVDQSNYQRLTTRLKAEYQAKMEAEKAAAAAKAKAEKSEESNEDNIDSDSELEGHKATFAVADEEEQTKKSE